ncbi:hypothetical protein [Methylicorpusculum sp.]|nr:hypothetical protein [Methylicorpusculum sp.]MDP2177381.1 hypothetical protein [Methylicorpusculum sp.]MDP3530972.1 hypothetical protein [Methylicorpusculum sp.]MDZ4154434.1 hypothetical protein [Methylicorpusculum sp.]
MIKHKHNVGWISGSASTQSRFFPESVDALALIHPTPRKLREAEQ